MQYRGILPTERVFGWRECRHFPKGHYILMHSVIFRTKLLKKAGIRLPEHTFYVDNLYVFEPLPFVKKMYYLDVNFYRYFIGREDQSVHESVMIARIDQQLKVNRLMIDYLSKNRMAIMRNRRLFQYMLSYLEIIMSISSIMLIRSGTAEHLQKKRELWEYLREKDAVLYRKLRYGILGHVLHLPGKCGRKMSLGLYHICKKIFKFN